MASHWACPDLGDPIFRRYLRSGGGFGVPPPLGFHATIGHKLAEYLPEARAPVMHRRSAFLCVDHPLHRLGTACFGDLHRALGQKISPLSLFVISYPYGA